MKFPVEMILKDPFSILRQPLLEEWFRRGWDRWVYTDGTPVVLPNSNQLVLFVGYITRTDDHHYGRVW